MREYKPRRQTKRWLDGDCPSGVLAVLDNGGKTFDRYTVVYAEPVSGASYGDMWLGYRGMSENPFDPQGYGIYGEMSAHDMACYRATNKRHYAKWSGLPDAVKRCVIQDLI